MKIAHLADLHIGSSQYGISERQQYARETNIKLAKETSIDHDLIIVAGDVFDSNIPSPDDVKTWITMCNIWNDSGCKVVACTGNHDKVRKQTQWIELGAINLSESALSEDGSAFLISEDVLPLKIVSLNHHRKSSLKDVIQKIPDNLDVVVMHQSTIGFLASIMKPELDVDDINILSHKCKYLALGDLHVHKKMKVNSCVIAYPGNIDFLRLCDPINDFKYISMSFDIRSNTIESIESINFTPIQKTVVHDFESIDKTLDLIKNEDFNIFRYDSVNSSNIEEINKKIISDCSSRCFYFHKNTKKKVNVTTEDSPVIDDEMDFIEMVEKDKTLEKRDVKIIEDIWKNYKPEFVNDVLKQDLQNQINENKEG
jgi:exonuclease SbcD